MSSEIDLVELGRLCRSFRKARGITVKAIAEKAHYSVWSVYAFEQGRSSSVLILLTYEALGFRYDDQ